MGTFPMCVENSCCDKPLPKYLASKTVLIYCPHPVWYLCTVAPLLYLLSDLLPSSQAKCTEYMYSVWLWGMGGMLNLL